MVRLTDGSCINETDGNGNLVSSIHRQKFNLIDLSKSEKNSSAANVSVAEIKASSNEDIDHVVTSSVVDFYRHRSVFITGATGFMGKVLVHKLLKHCSDLTRIFVLIRPKRGSTPEERLSSLLSVPIFEGMPEKVLEKVTVVQGDITLDRLGISKEDEQTLIDSVSVVFHCAATVRFDDDLTKSIDMNIEGTRRITDLAKKLSKLRAFVHTSTAYSHCYMKSTIEEKVYSPKSTSLDTVVDLFRISETSDEIRTALNHPVVTKAVIGEHPNTYTFTKALAEQFLYESASELPLAIVRPSIVIAAWKEPLPGWMDNLNGPTGLITGAASGLLRTVMVAPDKVADLIPVDVAINLMCVVASRIGSGSRNSEIPVYHCTSGSTNPVTWGEIREHIEAAIAKWPFLTGIWYPSLMYQTDPRLQKILFFVLHKVPSVFLDTGLSCFRIRPFLKKIVGRMEKTMEALEYFSTGEWCWNTDNMEKLEHDLSPEDRDIFPLSLQDLNWVNYMDLYVYGCRHYVLKEKTSDRTRAVIKFNILWALQILTVWFCFWLFLSIVSMFDPVGIMDNLIFNAMIGFVCAVILLFRGK